jgi:hypothetical protein
VKPLFDHALAYPQDGVGPYTELDGIVTRVGTQDEPDDEVAVTVKTADHGELTGYTPRPPKVGYTARIRVYECGGGWYPDNRIMGWSCP